MVVVDKAAMVAVATVVRAAAVVATVGKVVVVTVVVVADKVATAAAGRADTAEEVKVATAVAAVVVGHLLQFPFI